MRTIGIEDMEIDNRDSGTTWLNYMSPTTDPIIVEFRIEVTRADLEALLENMDENAHVENES